jgi:hypothetical protein
MKTLPQPQFRFRAVSMDLIADLDERYVEMRIITGDGTTIAVECHNDAIFQIQRHIDHIAQECPEVMTWPRQCEPEALITGLQ